MLRMQLRVGEVLSATIRRKLSTNRVLISLKGHVLVAEPEHEVAIGDEIQVQILSIFPRIRLRLLNAAQAVTASNRRLPLDLHT